MKNIAVYPGSFDPITNGHIDVIHRCLKIVDKIIIAISSFQRKDFLLTIEERTEIIKETFKNDDRIEIDKFDGLLVNYLKEKNINIIVRGLRAISDFEYEFQMALTNRKLNKNIETIFIMPGEEYFFISSTMVKEIAKLKGQISCFVPPAVEKKLKEKFNY
ncbi:MAG TPA: pantetheine-phosphate adenylyltransferase [Candidatus Ratteibacteria bacterium]|nr:pantetheine-phosphate adenylyltransferase [bacterium]HRR95172.1 pantetheine-phosphate adenylyltransferase [Candidatus Ratteibacteria bacterium]